MPWAATLQDREQSCCKCRCLRRTERTCRTECAANARRSEHACFHVHAERSRQAPLVIWGDSWTLSVHEAPWGLARPRGPQPAGLLRAVGVGVGARKPEIEGGGGEVRGVLGGRQATPGKTPAPVKGHGRPPPAEWPRGAPRGLGLEMGAADRTGRWPGLGAVPGIHGPQVPRRPGRSRC